ncbi:MAG: hypothetical protein M1825_001090 [Sarcosagium campestre]|nr:MAG: hypothetical protein M1825_001090 [Sarcosagium campestre]
MLSAFSARPLVELKQRDKSRIDSVLTFEGDRLFVGLNTGNLRIYRVNELSQASNLPDGPGRNAVDLLRELEKFSRRSVEQLAVIKEANILVALSDACITTHDLQSPNYDLQEQLAKTKGASTFAVASNIVKDPSTGIPSLVSRLAVVVKRKILLWSWHDSELSSETPEIVLTAVARTLTWVTATKLVCGLNSGYVLVDVDSQTISDISSPGSIGGAGTQEAGRFGGVGTAGMGYMGMGNWIPKPLATKLTNSELLLSKDINTLFIDCDGNPLEKRQIPWSSAPEAIAFSYPFVLALQAPSKGMLEVRSPETQSLLQSIALPNASVLHVPQPNVSLAHAGKGFLVASDRCIWRMEAKGYASQVDELVEGGQLDEAISLLNMIEDALLENKEERLREIKMQKAQILFDNRRYRDSLDLFAEVSAPPERVIRLFPKVIAGDLAESQPAMGSPSEPHQQKPDADANGDAASDTVSLSNSTKDRTKDASKADAGDRKPGSETASVRSSSKNGLGEGIDRNVQSGQSRVLEGKDLKKAILELYGFLVQTRTQLQRYLDPNGGLKQTAQGTQTGRDGTHKAAFETLLVAPTSSADVDREQKLRDTAKLVDTTLFRAYMVENPARSGSLFRIPNFCDPDVVKEKLIENERYEDLVDFLHGKKLHQSALELLKRLGESDDLVKTSAALKGPRRTIRYLQTLSPEHIDLILEFASWTLQKDPDLAMDIFLADTENAETLPRDRVIGFLEDVGIDLTLRYLEHVIHELDDLTPAFHQKLVVLYLERLGVHKGVVRHDAFQHHEELRDRLLDFLKTSSQYSTAKTFQLLPSNSEDFYEARAIVLSKMGNHRQALEIYVFKLHDHDKAEEYCNHVHVTQEASTSTKVQTHLRSAEESESTESIYRTLLSLYLTPPPPHKPDWAPALGLLSKHGSRLPASSTLNLIPASLPVQELAAYFQGRIRSANSIVNEGRVVSGLCKSELVRMQEAAMLGDRRPGGNQGRNRSVVIDDERVCGVCHRRLGGSAISVFADNSVVHYGCANQANRRGKQQHGWA